MGYVGSFVSPRSDRTSSLEPLGSVVAFLCLVNEFSSCTFTKTRDFSLVKIEEIHDQCLITMIRSINLRLVDDFLCVGSTALSYILKHIVVVRL